MNLCPIHIADLQRHRSVPSAREIDRTGRVEREPLNFAGKIAFRQKQEFVQRFRINFLRSHVYFRVQ
jgi:hypothetical protein